MNISFVFPVDAMLSSYSEAEVDLVLRVMNVVKSISGSLGLKEAFCNSPEAGPWFSFSDDTWTVKPRLEIDDSFSFSRSCMDVLVDKNPSVLSMAGGAYYVSTSGREGDRDAILDQVLVDGTRLTQRALLDEYQPVTADRVHSYRETCWRASHGLEGIRTSLGEPDATLGEFVFPEEQKAQHQMTDLCEQFCYFEIDPQFVVFIREFSNGFVAPILAGKKI